MAHGLHLPGGGIDRSVELLEVAFKNEEGSTYFTSPALRVTRKAHLAHTIFAEALEFLASVTSSSARPCVLSQSAARTTADKCTRANHARSF